MKKQPSYKDYVKPDLIKDFEKFCETNSKDFYSSGCVTTAHLVMRALMQHTYEGVWKERKISPKKAWKDAMRENPFHSGMSAALSATIIAQFSPRGEEFKNWCIRDNVVWVKWNKEKKKINSSKRLGEN